MRLVHAELLKVRTAPRTTIGLLLGLAAISVLGGGSAASSDAVADEAQIWDVLSIGTTGTIFALILGILIVTWEYRHGTITPTYLLTPRRDRVLAAKYATSFVLGLALTLICLAVALVTASFFTSLELTGDQWQLVARIVIAGGIWAVLGAGLGALLQSQVGAIVAVFVWFLLVENLIGARFENLADYLPGRVLGRSMERGGEAAFDDFGGGGETFGVWAALAVAAGYAAVFGALGIVSAVRRDV